MKVKCIFCKRIKEAILDNSDYTKIMDKKDLEMIFHHYFKLPKYYWFTAIKQLEEDGFISQVSRGRGGIKYLIEEKR